MEDSVAVEVLETVISDRHQVAHFRLQEEIVLLEHKIGVLEVVHVQ